MVGGNGPNVTWRLAARHADELNVDGMSPDEVADGAAGDPGALRGDRPRPGDARGLGPRLGRATSARPGARGSTGWPAYRELGRQPGDGPRRACTATDEALESLVEDARAAGVELA